ncbi:MAG: hypothetical protein WBB31_13430 [Saprospiraceae bacterium]
MKKVTLMLFVTLMFMVTNTALCRDNLPSDGIKIIITIEVGVPIICTPAWSICKVGLGGSALTGTAELLETADGKSTGPGSARSLMISISRDNFAKYYPGYLSKLDGKNTVTFESSYTFPPEVKKALGSSTDLIIQGNMAYPLTYGNGVYTITFPL